MANINASEIAKKYGGVVVFDPKESAANKTPEPPKRSWMEKILGFTGGEKLAQGLGQAIAQPFIKKDLDAIQSSQGEMQQKIIDAIKQKRARGEDTSNLQKALKTLTGDIADTGANAENLYNPYQLTGKQVVGDALQLGTTVASVGTFGSAASGAKSGVLLRKAPTVIAKTIGANGIKAGIIQGAKTGAISGALFGVPTGVAQGLKEDLSAGEIVKKGFTGGVTGGILGGVVGGLIGGVSGALRQRSLRKDILKAQEREGLRPQLTETIQTRMKNDPKFEILVREARKQGFNDAEINFLSTISPDDRATMEKMYNLTVKAQSDPRQITRAGDVLGDTVASQVEQVQKLNQAHGIAVDRAARALKGQTVDASAVLNRADDVLSNAGVTVGDDGSLNFTKSIFKKSPELQKRIANALSDLPTGDIDAYELHKFKKSIDEVVNYGTAGEGLRGSSANILKSIRNSADEVLDNTFDAYNAANTDYKLTRDYIDIAKGVVGKKVDLASREGKQAFGQALRSAFSNNKSRPNTLKFIEDTHLISQKLGLEGSEKNILDQALFVNMLEDTFGSEASTGLAGEVSKGVKAAQTASRLAEGMRSPIKGALDVAATATEKLQNITPEAKKQVLAAFLRDGRVTNKIPTGLSKAAAEEFTIFTDRFGRKTYYVPVDLADDVAAPITKKAPTLAEEAAAAAAAKGTPTRLFDAQQTQFENLIRQSKFREALKLAESLVAKTTKEQSMKKSLIETAKRYVE